MNERLKYIFRIVCSVLVALGGIGWIAMYFIDIFINKVTVTPGTVIVPFLGICLAGIGVLLLIYTISENKHRNSAEDEE